MELKNTVTSYELSKKLEELGIWNSKPLAFYYSATKKLYFNPDFNNYDRELHSKIIPAYTAEELLEIMPDHLENGSLQLNIACNKRPDEKDPHYYVSYGYENVGWLTGAKGYTLCDTLAQFLIELLENKIITVEDLKL